MVSFSALMVTAALALSAVAAPSSSRLASRVHQRQSTGTASGAHSHPAQRVDPSTTQADGTNDSGQVVYTENWAGAVYGSYPAGSFNSVSGTFTVPSPTMPPGTNGTYAATAWVGIDGDTCSTAILQSGVDFLTDGITTSYFAWFEWFPAGWSDFQDITFNTGDVVTITVTATSSTTGTAVILNQSSGQSVSQALESTTPLCQENAEWIVEDYSADGLVPFADFGIVTFSDNSATLISGGTIDASNASIFDITQNNVVLTSTEIGETTVVVTYTGQ